MNSYKKYRNQVNTLNKPLKKRYFSDKVSHSKGNTKESWQTINQLLNKRSQSTNIVSLKDSYQTTFDKESIWNKINELIYSIGKKLAADIDDTANSFLSKDISVNDGGRTFDFWKVKSK